MSQFWAVPKQERRAAATKLGMVGSSGNRSSAGLGGKPVKYRFSTPSRMAGPKYDGLAALVRSHLVRSSHGELKTQEGQIDSP